MFASSTNVISQVLIAPNQTAKLNMTQVQAILQASESSTQAIRSSAPDVAPVIVAIAAAVVIGIASSTYYGKNKKK